MKRCITVMTLYVNQYSRSDYFKQPVMMIACRTTEDGYKWRTCRIFDRPHTAFGSAVVDATIWSEAEGVPVILGLTEGDPVEPDEPEPLPVVEPVPPVETPEPAPAAAVESY